MVPRPALFLSRDPIRFWRLAAIVHALSRLVETMAIALATLPDMLGEKQVRGTR
jgi:hypothetical protein